MASGGERKLVFNLAAESIIDTIVWKARHRTMDLIKTLRTVRLQHGLLPKKIYTPLDQEKPQAVSHHALQLVEELRHRDGPGREGFVNVAVEVRIVVEILSPSTSVTVFVALLFVFLLWVVRASQMLGAQQFASGSRSKLMGHIGGLDTISFVDTAEKEEEVRTLCCYCC